MTYPSWRSAQRPSRGDSRMRKRERARPTLERERVRDMRRSNLRIRHFGKRHLSRTADIMRQRRAYPHNTTRAGGPRVSSEHARDGLRFTARVRFNRKQAERRAAHTRCGKPKGFTILVSRARWTARRRTRAATACDRQDATSESFPKRAEREASDTRDSRLDQRFAQSQTERREKREKREKKKKD